MNRQTIHQREALSAFCVEMRLPPSTNNLFINRGRRRVKSPAYRFWIDQAIKTIWAQVRADRRIGGRINVAIQIPEKMRGDADNRIKGVLDVLVQSGRIDDDKNVVGLSIHRHKDIPADTARVEVTAA